MAAKNKITLPRSVPKAVVDQCPKFVSAIERGPVGPWDTLPDVVVYVPIEPKRMTHDEETVRSRTLCAYYGLTAADATRHARWENTSVEQLPGRDDIAKARESAKPMRTGQEDWYISSARNTKVRLERQQEVMHAVASRAEKAKDDAEADLRARHVAVVRQWRAGTHAQYTPDLGFAITAFNAAKTDVPDTAPRDTLLQPPPSIVNYDYCVAQSRRVGSGPIPSKTEGLSTTQHRSAATAAILGAFMMECERVGLEGEFRVRKEIRAVHHQLLDHITKRSEIQGQRWEQTANAVLSSCPNWISMRLSGKASLKCENLFLKYEVFWSVTEKAMIGVDPMEAE